jgi:type IV secretion system protein VirB9
MESRFRTSAAAGRQTASGAASPAGAFPVPIDVESFPAPPERVEVPVERPIYIPAAEKPQTPTGTAAVQEAAQKGGIVSPSDYSHMAMIYDYHRDQVYEVYSRPLRTTDLCLEPGEKAVETPFISDSERWMLGAGVSQEQDVTTQHIYIKPNLPGIEASLIINTDRRVYHVILRSYTDVYMPIVRWRYPALSMPNNYAAPFRGQESPGTGGGAQEPITSVDPRFLSFDYKITYSWFKKPSWLPTLVYDDGKKTYISFPESVLQAELPAVFENRQDITNYRVVGSLIIIDKLIEKITVKRDGLQVTIEKKRS